MSHMTHYASMALASVALVGGSLSVTTPAYAGGSNDVDGADCLKHDDDRECRSRTRLDADERSRSKSRHRVVELTADVDFYQKDDDGPFKRGFGHDDDDLGEVKFQYRWDRDDDWKTFFVEDVDEDGEADVRVRIRIKRDDEVTLRAKYSGVDDEIRGSTSNRVEID